MMLKSYRGDFPLAQRLIESFNTFNVDRLPLTIVVPPEDVELFSSLAGPQITVLDESVFAPHLVSEPFGGMRLGYINQQIVKLAFWEQDIYDDYFTVDSELVFVRPFHRSDFMLDESTPFTVLVEDNDLQTDPRYFHEYWRGRTQYLERIKDAIDFSDPRSLTCHGHQIMSGTVLRSLVTDFMEPRGYTYADLLRISPYEFSWYNFWLQKSRVIPVAIREPLVKVVHHDGQHLEYAVRGTTVEDIARGYVGLVINSSFARIWPDIHPRESQSATLSRYVPASVLLSALAQKVRLIPSLFRRRK